MNDATVRYVKERIGEGFRELELPAYMMEGVDLWVMHGLEPGDFLSNVFKNNLVEAAIRADTNNLAKLAEWAYFVYNYVPANCWGSGYDAWLEDGGMFGREKKLEAEGGAPA